jgi:hypothetical protein
MQSDPIVDEIHRVREQIAARFGYDIQAIGRDAHQRDKAADREVTRRPPRRPVASTSAKLQVPPATAIDRT